MTQSREPQPKLDKPGPLGESLAVTFLEKQGYKIEAVDFRVGPWQVDILARDGSEPVVVEVKSRRGEARPEVGLTPAQAERLLKAGQIYFKDKRCLPRLDLVTVRFKKGSAPVLHLNRDLRLFL